MSDRDCEVFQPLIPELALGMLEGRERADTLAHIEHCPACQHELLLTGDVADHLVELTPPAEPPAGFETRVLARIEAARAEVSRSGVAAGGGVLAAGPGVVPASLLGSGAVGSVAASGAVSGGAMSGGAVSGGAVSGDAVSEGAVPLLASGAATSEGAGGGRAWRGRRGWRAVAAAAVAAVVAGFVGVGGWTLGHHAASPAVAFAPAGGKPVVAELVSDKRPVGEMMITGRPYWWMSMAVESPFRGDRVICELREADGTTVRVGSFTLSHGYGYWAAPVPETTSPFTSARLIDSHGRTLGTASWGNSWSN